MRSGFYGGLVVAAGSWRSDARFEPRGNAAERERRYAGGRDAAARAGSEQA